MSDNTIFLAMEIVAKRDFEGYSAEYRHTVNDSFIPDALSIEVSSHEGKCLYYTKRIEDLEVGESILLAPWSSRNDYAGQRVRDSFEVDAELMEWVEKMREIFEFQVLPPTVELERAPGPA